MKVAIVGFSPSRDEAPWGTDWEIWGLAWDPLRLQFHRVFEMHQLSMLDAGQVDRLQDCERLYMQDAYPQVPNSLRYPFEDVAQTTGEYWCSSVAYALALAIHEGAEEIGLFGVDGSEQYSYQHPNLNYLLGLAVGRGVKVHLPEGCPLLKFVSDPDFSYRGRYGRLQ